MSRWVAAGWFTSAYAPLFVLLAVKEYALNQHTWAYVLLGAAVAGALVSRVALIDRVTPASRSFPVERGGVQSDDVELSTYMVTFVLPFVAITGATNTDVLVLVGFFVFLGYLLVHSRTLLPNPVLSLLGYRWKLVILRSGEQIHVLVSPSYPLHQHTNPPIPVGIDAVGPEPRIEVCNLADGMWLAKEIGENGGTG